MLGKLKNISPARLRGKKANDISGQYIVGLDIGTEYVKALIARVNGETLEVVGVGRAHQELADMQAGAIADISAVVANCDRALTDAEKQAGLSARTAVIGIAGELVKGATTTIKCSRKDPNRALDAAEVEKIIALVQKRAEAKARKELAWELGGKEIEIKLVNSALVAIDIDGYRVTNPVGFQGKEVMVQLYTAFAPLIHIGALERTAQELDLDLLAVAAEPFAVARSVIGDDPNATMSAILMDVGGGTTDIAIINEGGVQGTKMFGIGGRAFTKSIERDTGLSFADSEQLKLALNANRIQKAKAPIVATAINKTLDVWLSGVELALAEFTNLDNLPSKLLLCGGGSSMNLLVQRLEREKWYSLLPFTRRPVVQHIKPQEVSGIIDKTGDVTDHTFITALGLLRVGNDTLMSENTKGGGAIRERIDRILKV